MTALQAAYRELCDQGRTHHAALRALANRYDLDKETVERVLRKADREDKRWEERRAS